MKQLAIVSGKGGTGKTTVTAALASLIKGKVIVDCDVDAADLHLILDPKVERREIFPGGRIARIDRSKCNDCGRCRELCRFGAISERFEVEGISCEGCGVCVWNCPQNAVSWEAGPSGEWYVSSTRHGPMVHARLGIAQENSGKLVTLIRSEAKRIAEEEGHEYVLIDGPPGIACPVMASLTGVDSALMVTEPTLSGLHDLDRIADLMNLFKINGFVCVNKYDLNLEQTARIAYFCQKKGLAFIGGIPFDPVVTKAMVAGKTILEYSDGPVSRAIEELWARMSAS